jgi:enamine deaminase RidA (YjgF/YER057c/UK114 family)
MQSAPEPIIKRVEYYGVPWEAGYGYGQAVQAGNVIYVSGQLSHDEEGELIGPAPTRGASSSSRTR